MFRLDLVLESGLPQQERDLLFRVQGCLPVMNTPDVAERDMARQYECCVTIRVLYDDTLPFVNEWVWSKVRSNGTFFFTFSREPGPISKKWQVEAT